jgi:hypothetical protein
MPIGVWVGFGIEVLATLFLFAFVVRASAAVQAADAEGLIVRSALVAGAINVGLVLASLRVMAARYVGSGHGLDGQGVITLAYLGWGSYVMSWPAMGIFLGALVAGALRTHAFPAWLGWTGVAVAVIGLGQLRHMGPSLVVVGAASRPDGRRAAFQGYGGSRCSARGGGSENARAASSTSLSVPVKRPP